MSLPVPQLVRQSRLSPESDDQLNSQQESEVWAKGGFLEPIAADLVIGRQSCGFSLVRMCSLCSRSLRGVNRTLHHTLSRKKTNGIQDIGEGHMKRRRFKPHGSS